MGWLNSLFDSHLVGLDIGISGIKAVELQVGKTPRLIAYNRLPLPLETVTAEGEIRDRKTLVMALKTLMDFKGFTTKRVAVGAAGNAVITKKISVQRMSREELANQLYWEAEQYLPFNIAEITLDFTVLGDSPTPETGSGMIDVLLVAAKRDYIQNLTSIIEEAGLKPEVIDSQAFALGNAFEFNYAHALGSPGGSYVLVDFGAGSTKISIVEKDKTVFSRELRLSGMACTQMISERLGIPIGAAERAKVSESNNAAVQEATREFVGRIVQEISRTIDYFVSQTSGATIQGVYVCGGGAQMDGLLGELNLKAPAPVQVLNPVQKVAGSGQKMSTKVISDVGQLGTVAVGLALREVNDSI